MGLLFGQERRQWAPEPPIAPFPGFTWGGATQVNTKEQALGNSTVYSCVGTIANSVSLMALKTYTGAGIDALPRRVPDPAIVTSPSPGMTQADFLHQIMVSLLLRGNAYAHINEFDNRMRARQCELLDPDSITPKMNDGQIEYWSRGVKIPTAEVWHIRGMTMPGAKVGLSPIAYGALSMGVELEAAKFARDFFAGGGIPKAVLETDMNIDNEQAKTLKERLVAATRNREPVALGSGVKYVPISVKPDESQFVATLQNSVATVARFFFMPPEMVGGSSGSSMTYANREQRALDYLTLTIAPWLKRLEDAFFPMLPAPQYVQFDESNLLRTDAETQAKVRVQYIAGKVLPPSRVLASMNEAPLTEAEKEELELVPLTVTATGAPRVTLKGGAPNVDPGKIVEPETAPEG